MTLPPNYVDPHAHTRDPDQVMHDRDLMAKVVYEAYYQLHPCDRQRSQWIMTQDMHDWIRDLCGIPPPEPPDPDNPTPRTDRSYLLGLSIEIRDGVEGVRLEREPSSWYCAPVAGVLAQAKAPTGWHERGCPHIDWTKAPAGPGPFPLPFVEIG